MKDREVWHEVLHFMGLQRIGHDLATEQQFEEIGRSVCTDMERPLRHMKKKLQNSNYSRIPFLFKTLN